MLTFLAEQPILLLAVLLLVGAALGSVRIGGVSIGPAAVLFGAIAVSAVAAASGIRLELPHVVGTLGLVLFTYTVGITSGPSFFSSVRHGWPVMLSVTLAVLAAAAVAVGLGAVLGLEAPVVAGTFAGALTNTPALAAATESSGDPAGPTIGYSISYVWGVVGMLLAAGWVLAHRRRDEPPASPPLVHETIRVDRTDLPTIGDLLRRHGDRVVFTRLRRGDEPETLLDETEALHEADLVTVVGPRDVVEAVATWLGHRSSHDIALDRHELDYRRITISNARLAGRTLAEVDLPARFGAHVSRVRRGDLDLLASPDFVLQLGDRLRVIAPVSRMAEVSAHLGDSERGMSDINPGGFALGLTLGVLLGLVHIPLPGGGFSLGAAAGTLFVGLVFGRLGRVGPVVTSMPSGAARSLSHFGMITFLAYAGTQAGQQITAAITSDLGWKVAVLGLVVTTAAVLLLVAAGRLVHRSGSAEHAGILAGAQTQPAVLAFADERSGHDTRVGIGYVLAYPVAMVAKILVAQVLAAL
ncbi:aspartate:alanine exchanger family transporter [Intrasporangium sp.]|uniref:aspartate:alanine exchanger family transporter n=1 Tax=Intrasporangium sp. TaxID=1925024 RepID=UPI00293AA22A|nr:TrkA C-terminal domain-containing protein [Intrasporangium sp.]MDV3223216.1 transporter [Intrasporangium sp.]